jgi:hypothetical protein
MMKTSGDSELMRGYAPEDTVTEDHPSWDTPVEDLISRATKNQYMTHHRFRERHEDLSAVIDDLKAENRRMREALYELAQEQ